MATATKQKAQFRDLKFKTQKQYDKWLKEHTFKKIEFEETGGDFTSLRIHESGEIIDCEFYTMNRIYLGGFVDLDTLEVGKPIFISNVLGDKKGKFYNGLIVESIK